MAESRHADAPTQKSQTIRVPWTRIISSSRTRLLIINPNSSGEMTAAMAANFHSLHLFETIEISTYTAPPTAPPSINNNEDMYRSYEDVYDDITPDLLDSDFSGVLIACYSRHQLVSKLSQRLGPNKFVTGIFEASILAALSIAPSATAMHAKWGIITTGAFWEKQLADDVECFLGTRNASSSFAGVFSTGLSAGDFHSVSEEEVRRRLGEATRRLLDEGDVRCVIMGCAGMAGLEDIIRATAIEKYGELEGRQVFIIDSVKAGVMQLEQMARYNTVFR